MLHRRHSGSPNWLRVGIAGLLLASGFLPGCDRASGPERQNSPADAQKPAARPERPPNVLIVTIDTLRADRLGCYGHKRPTSPNIDEFAKQSVLFTNCHSTSSFTPPAHASLFTSQHVSQHGVLTWRTRLEDKAITLAEVLRDKGYRTASSVALLLISRINLGQGCEWTRERRYDERVDGKEIIEDALKLIQEYGENPWYIWLHVYDVHRPYGRQPEWTRKFNPNGRAGVGDGEEHYQLTPDKLSRQKLSDEDLKFIEDRYDAGVAYIDSELRRLLDAVSSPQRQADTLVVLTSDHGENLREHRRELFTHDPFLYRVITHIPLIIRFPGARGGGQKRDALTSIIDVAPTVLDEAGIPIPRFYQGRSLQPLIRSPEWPRTELFMETWVRQVRQPYKAVRDRAALIVQELQNTTTAPANEQQDAQLTHELTALGYAGQSDEPEPKGRAEFFDLTSDPEESRPLSQPFNEHARRLYDKLLEFIRLRGLVREDRPDDPDITPEEVKALGALGYVDPNAEDPGEPASRPSATLPGEIPPADDRAGDSRQPRKR